MIPILDGLLTLASQIAIHLNLKEAHKYIDDCAELKAKILAERAKEPADVDDAKLSALYGALDIAMDSLTNSLSQGMNS